MIKLEINYDFIIKVTDITKIDSGIPGIYVLLDQSNKPLYVGIAEDMKKRTINHINGHTNAREYHTEIAKIAYIYEPDEEIRNLVELYLIRTFEDVRNFNQPYPFMKRTKKVGFNGVNLFGKCQHFKGCENRAQSNGYCHFHGGNGESVTYIQERAVEEYLQKHFPTKKF